MCTIVTTPNLREKWIRGICCSLMWHALCNREAILAYGGGSVRVELNIASAISPASALGHAISFCPWCGVKITVEEETK